MPVPTPAEYWGGMARAGRGPKTKRLRNHARWLKKRRERRAMLRETMSGLTGAVGAAEETTLQPAARPAEAEMQARTFAPSGPAREPDIDMSTIVQGAPGYAEPARQPPPPPAPPAPAYGQTMTGAAPPPAEIQALQSERPMAEEIRATPVAAAGDWPVVEGRYRGRPYREGMGEQASWVSPSWGPRAGVRISLGQGEDPQGALAMYDEAYGGERQPQMAQAPGTTQVYQGGQLVGGAMPPPPPPPPMQAQTLPPPPPPPPVQAQVSAAPDPQAMIGRIQSGQLTPEDTQMLIQLLSSSRGVR